MPVESFGIKAPSENRFNGTAELRPTQGMIILADKESGTGEVGVYAVVPSKRTFQIYNPGGGTVRIDVTNDPDLGWNTNYISTTSELDFYSESMPWHYIRVYIESQGSPAEITVKMGV